MTSTFPTFWSKLLIDCRIYYAMVTRIQYVYCNVDLMLVYYLFILLLFFFFFLSVFFLIFLPLNIDLQVICFPVYIDLISFFVFDLHQVVYYCCPFVICKLQTLNYYQHFGKFIFSFFLFPFCLTSCILWEKKVLFYFTYLYIYTCQRKKIIYICKNNIHTLYIYVQIHTNTHTHTNILYNRTICIFFLKTIRVYC